MLVRFITIFLLVVLVLRLLGKLLVYLARHRAAVRQRGGPGSTRRELAECPQCGTYFDPERTLDAPRRKTLHYCSTACLDAQRSGNEAG